jgi:hypothetical protein
MAKPTTFGRKSAALKFSRDVGFDFGANLKPRRRKAGGKARKAAKGGGS